MTLFRGVSHRPCSCICVYTNTAAVLRYSYTYDMIFITYFLKRNINYV